MELHDPHFSLTGKKWMATLRKRHKLSRLVVGQAQWCWNEGKAHKSPVPTTLEIDGAAEVTGSVCYQMGIGLEWGLPHACLQCVGS